LSIEYAYERVPSHAADRSAKSIALLISSTIMGVPCIILGGSLGTGYGWNRAILVIAIGCALTGAIAALAAYAGVRSRRTAALLAKRTFGTQGAALLNAVIVLALIGWFAVEMGFIGDMIASSARGWISPPTSRAAGIVAAGVVVCVIVLRGMTMINRASRLFLPLLATLLAAVLFLTLRSAVSTAAPRFVAQTLGSGVSAIIGSYIVGCLVMPDYSRFIRSGPAAMTATMVVLGPIYAFVLGTYALAALATRQTLPTEILSALGFPAVIGLLLPLGLLQNGIVCLYSSSLASSQLAPRVPIRRMTMLLAIVGGALALIGVNEWFVSFLVILGAVFAPAVALLILTGILTSDQRHVDRDWSLPHLVAWLLGVGTGIISEVGGISFSGFSTLDGFAVSIVAGLIIHGVQRPRGDGKRSQLRT
jgi:cytosine permease